MEANPLLKYIHIYSGCCCFTFKGSSVQHSFFYLFVGSSVKVLLQLCGYRCGCIVSHLHFGKACRFSNGVP